MQKVEINSKLYEVDTSQISLGDFYRALSAIQEKKDSTEQVYTTLVILRKALGEQMDSIPIAYYGYVFGQVTMLMVTPFSSEDIDNEVRKILDEADIEEEEE